MLSTSDVFLTNYRQNALAKIGFSAEQLHERFPHLIICVISGFGREGPDSSRPGYDLAAFWARSGLAKSCTATGYLPFTLSPGAGDHATAMAAAAGVCAALIQKGKTGKGQIVDTSLLSVGVYTNSWNTASYLRFNRVPKQPPRNSLPNPMLNCYMSKDKKGFWIVGLESERHWPNTAKALGLEKLLDDPRFSNASKRRTNSKVLISIFDDCFASLNFEELAAKFEEHDVWYAPIQDVDEVTKDPQVIANGMIVNIPPNGDGPHLASVATPVRFNNSNTTPKGPVPKPGEHTKDILINLGLDPDKVEILAKL